MRAYNTKDTRQVGAGFALWLVAACMLLVACSNTASQPGNGSSAVAIDAPANALMVVIDDPRSERQRRGISSPGYSASIAYDDDPALKRAASRLARDHELTIVSQWPLRNLAVHCLVVEAPTEATVQALTNDPRVRWLQPFNEFATQAMPGDSAVAMPRNIKDLFSSLVEQGAGVRIAVVDTAIDQSHPDLLDSSVRQLNFAGRRGRPTEEEHGTAVVGLISAMPGKGDGVTGLAKEADVRVLRACWQSEGEDVGRCNTLTLALALDAAIDLRPQVLNLSLTGQYDRVLEELLSVLLADGTIVIAAYDEERRSNERFPAAQPGVVYAYGAADPEVGPLDTAGTVLTAPRHAMSLAPMAGYDLVSGHSIAAPHISALTARLIEGQPRATRAQILTQLSDWLRAY